MNVGCQSEGLKPLCMENNEQLCASPILTHGLAVAIHGTDLLCCDWTINSFSWPSRLDKISPSVYIMFCIASELLQDLSHL